MNRSSINYGLVKNAHNFWIKGSRVKCSGYRIQNNLKHEVKRHFKNKKKECLIAKRNDHEANSKNKNIRDLYTDTNDFKKGYQPITNILKGQEG